MNCTFLIGCFRATKKPRPAMKLFNAKPHVSSSSPIVPGHEVIGRVASVGDGVSAFKVGDRVGGGWHGGHDGMLFIGREREIWLIVRL